MKDILVTARQQQIYDFIAKHIDKHGYPPTRQEIASEFDFGTNAAQCHLIALAKKGVLRITDKAARGIVLLA